MSYEDIEDVIYDIYAFKKFMGISFTEDQIPNSTTLLKFRHMLEKNHISDTMLKTINYLLEQDGEIIKGGKIFDASIINASSFTKNKENSQNSEMYQSKIGNESKLKK